MIALLLLLALSPVHAGYPGFVKEWLKRYPAAEARANPSPDDFAARLARAAETGATGQVSYDPAYVRLKYPGGEPAADRGVCTDVVGRAYKALGVDLQKAVHEDMKARYSEYPKLWARRSPDSNIDHRRVPNLMAFFLKNGVALPLSKSKSDYAPGDIVAWDLGGGVMHVGLVVGGGKIAHHIGGQGPVVEDVLFDWRVIGHFRYAP
jgi:uncharacterized protein YijF (DUF1287 family)